LYKYILLFITISSSLYASCPSEFEQNSIEVGNMRGSFSGNIGTDDKLELKNDLDMKKSANNLSAKLQKGFKNHKFGFKLSKYKYSGKKKLGKDIIFNSENFAKSQMISSKLDLIWAKATYRYKIIDGINIGFNLNGLRVKTSINNTKYKKDLIIPSIAIDYKYSITDNMSLNTKISITPYGKNRATDSYAGIAFRLPFRNCSTLNIGYQTSVLNIESKKYQNNLSYSGLYAGIRFGF